MKLKLFILATLIFSFANNAYADNVGIRDINGRGKIRCGAKLKEKTYAYVDEDGFPKGYAVSLCKALATAIFDDATRYEIINADEKNMENLLATNKIDIMIGANSLPASKEIDSKISATTPILYEQQTILVKKLDNANSLNDYKGQKICVVQDTSDIYNMQKYMTDNDLDLQILPFKTHRQIKEAFLLNRCTIITGDGLFLQSLYENDLKDKGNFKIVPENIAIKPIYAYTLKSNQKLLSTVEWVFNALILAQDLNINSGNIEITIGSKDQSEKNLLGDSPSLWEKYELKPNWVRKYIKETGNFREIIQQNFGANGKYKIPAIENESTKDGGYLTIQPFL